MFLPDWWNWQTRGTQNPLPARASRFKSGIRYHERAVQMSRPFFVARVVLKTALNIVPPLRLCERKSWTLIAPAKKPDRKTTDGHRCKDTDRHRFIRVYSSSFYTADI